MLQCNYCQEWYHYKCQNLHEIIFKYHTDRPEAIWICDRCQNENKAEDIVSPRGATAASPAPNQDKVTTELTKMNTTLSQSFANVKQDFAVVKQDFADLKQDLTVVRQDIAGVRGDIAEIKDRLATVENKYSFADKDAFLAAVQEHTDELAMDIRAEQHEQNIRRSRIMISKIPSSYDDEKTFIGELADHLGIDSANYSIRKVIRVKRRNNPQNPFLLVDFSHESQKFQFLNKAVWDKLSNTPTDNVFNGIIITQDRTQKERDHYKKLKNLADSKNSAMSSAGTPTQKYVVRGLRLVTIDITSA